MNMKKGMCIWPFSSRKATGSLCQVQVQSVPIGSSTSSLLSNVSTSSVSLVYVLIIKQKGQNEERR